MRSIRTLLIAAVLAGIAGPALAFGQPDLVTAAPIEHVQEARYADAQPSPYAMNYADDAAYALGVRNGHWQASDTAPSNPLMPSVGGGMDSGRPMLRLQWR